MKKEQIAVMTAIVACITLAGDVWRHYASVRRDWEKVPDWTNLQRSKQVFLTSEKRISEICSTIQSEVPAMSRDQKTVEVLQSITDALENFSTTTAKMAESASTFSNEGISPQMRSKLVHQTEDFLRALEELAGKVNAQ